jgi:hypothetical protein
MKKSTRQAVNKSLTPEEKTILGNIRSLLEQLDSEEVSEDMDELATDEADEADVAMSDDPDDVAEVPEPSPEGDDDKNVMKACDDEDDSAVKKSSTPDEVANNDADKRMNAEDTDVENALAVLKSYLTGRTQVRKSANNYARLERKVDNLTTCVEGMLEGFGMVSTPAPVRKSTQALDRTRAIVNKSAQNTQREEDLSDVMTALFGQSN